MTVESIEKVRIPPTFKPRHFYPFVFPHSVVSMGVATTVGAFMWYCGRRSTISVNEKSFSNDRHNILNFSLTGNINILKNINTY